MASSIEWLKGGETWNPFRARLKEVYTGNVVNPLPVPIAKGKVGWMCVKVSPGCERCYAEQQNVTCGTNPGRNGTGVRYAADKLPLVELFLDEKTLLAPLHWKKPRLIFPCSMTDWMADFYPDEFRDKMLAVMALTPQHTYLTLTKRADRQRKYMQESHRGMQDQVAAMQGLKYPSKDFRLQWPLPNLWLGTSVEDQQRADERIPEILRTPAALRWLSIEPQLEAIDLSQWSEEGLECSQCTWAGREDQAVKNDDPPDDWHFDCPKCGEICAHTPLDELLGAERGISWAVVGLESGTNARPGNIEWPRQIVSQCQAAGCPVFVKQLGAKPYLHQKQSAHIDKPGFKFSMYSLEIESTIHLKDRKGGDISEWPEDLRVREYPKVKGAAA